MSYNWKLFGQKPIGGDEHKRPRVDNRARANQDNKNQVSLPQFPVQRIPRTIRWLRNKNYILISPRAMLHLWNVLVFVVSIDVGQRSCARHMLEMIIVENSKSHNRALVRMESLVNFIQHLKPDKRKFVATISVAFSAYQASVSFRRRYQGLDRNVLLEFGLIEFQAVTKNSNYLQ